MTWVSLAGAGAPDDRHQGLDEAPTAERSTPSGVVESALEPQEMVEGDDTIDEEVLEIPSLTEEEREPWVPLVIEGCEAALEEAGITEYTMFREPPSKTLKAPRRRKPDWPELTEMKCHVPQALAYRTGPGKIRYTGYVLINCRTALAVARLEEIAQEEAVRIFGKYRTVRSIRQYGTYNCRRLRDLPWVQSQHSFGNAIDIAGFRIRGYGWVNLKSHWTPKHRSQRKGSEFLRAVARRLVEEQVFTNVLTPEYNRAHENHFHLNLEPLDAIVARGGDIEGLHEEDHLGHPEGESNESDASEDDVSMAADKVLSVSPAPGTGDRTPLEQNP